MSVGGRWIRWAIPLAVVPVLILLGYGFRTDPRAIPSPLIGKPASAFSLKTFDGTPISLEGLRGRVVVLNFWASWCQPACYEEAPALERGWQAYKDRGLMMVGVIIWRISRAFGEAQPQLVLWIRAGAAAGMIGMAVQELTEFSLQLPGNAVMFCALGAIALHRSRRA